MQVRHGVGNRIEKTRGCLPEHLLLGPGKIQVRMFCAVPHRKKD